MLSPGVRQVTHALLTRPPLKCHMIWPKSPLRGISVRLACVKHAASVHPEPGSNSLKKYWSGFKTSLASLYPRLLFVRIVRYSSEKFKSLLGIWKLISLEIYYVSLESFQGCITVYLSRYRSKFPSEINSWRMLRILRIVVIPQNHLGQATFI